MDQIPTQRLLLVTGPAGAGRSTAINALEDLGFEAVNNMPLSFLEPLIQGGQPRRPMALGFDSVNRDFSTGALLALLDKLSSRTELRVELLFLECRNEVLLRRFSETRRRHPLAPAQTPADGIARDRDLLGAVRARADVVIDTSDMTPHDLRAELAQLFGSDGSGELAITLQSFSYKRGMPRNLDMVFDVRFLRNPYWIEELRGLNGRDRAVRDYVAADERYDAFYDHLLALVSLLLPAYVEEGKSHLSIGFGCTGGQHRSVALTEMLAEGLEDRGWRVSKRHSELERRGMVPLNLNQGKTA